MAYTDCKTSKMDYQASVQATVLLAWDTSRSQLGVLAPQQLRAARALVGWSREALAKKSGVPAITTKQFENGDTDPRLSTLHKWRRALEAAGVVFIDPEAKSDEGGPGVRLRSAKAKR
jgi:DNA-binding XRE family transcriptional regulator